MSDPTNDPTITYDRLEVVDILRLADTEQVRVGEIRRALEKVAPRVTRHDKARSALQAICELEPGSRGAYGKFVEAQKIAAEGLK